MKQRCPNCDSPWVWLGFLGIKCFDCGWQEGIAKEHDNVARDELNEQSIIETLKRAQKEIARAELALQQQRRCHCKQAKIGDKIEVVLNSYQLWSCTRCGVSIMQPE